MESFIDTNLNDNIYLSLEEESSIQYPRRAPIFSELNEDERRELWASLALRHTVGLGQSSHGKLIQHFGSAFNAVQAAPDWKNLGIAQAKAQMVADGVWRESAHKEWTSLIESDTGILLWTNPQYPVLLRHIYNPPILLYTKGDISLLSNATISMVGSRLCSKEGLQVASNMAAELSRVGITVVSGMAKGVDAMAHKAALNGVGRSIGVLGTGIDIYYPYENRKLYKDFQKHGLLITEYPLGMRALPQNFPARNRIVSGISLGVLIVEATTRSGSLITARLALEQNREVYAVPGPLTMQNYSGCHELIRQGAHPVFGAEDILNDLASPLQRQLESAPCLNLLRKRRRKGKNQVTLDEQESKVPVRILTPSHDTSKAPQTQGIMDSAFQDKTPDVLLPQHTEIKKQIPKSKVEKTRTTAPTQAYVEKPEQSCAIDHTQSSTTRPEQTTITSPTQAATKEHALLAYLADNQEVHIDIIAEALGLSAGKASSMLLILEMQGKVKRLAGMRYMLAKEKSYG